MSKQVVVTDRDGNRTTFDDVAATDVVHNILWLLDAEGKGVAVIRDWARAERVELTSDAEPDLEPGEVDLPPLGSIKVVFDESQKPLQEPWHIRYNTALERFRKTLADAREDVERKATGGCPCGRCGGDR